MHRGAELATDLSLMDARRADLDRREKERALREPVADVVVVAQDGRDHREHGASTLVAGVDELSAVADDASKEGVFLKLRGAELHHAAARPHWCGEQVGQRRGQSETGELALPPAKKLSVPARAVGG